MEKQENTQVTDYNVVLTKHHSPDVGLTYYWIRLDNFNLYSTDDLDKAQERLDHIQDIGMKAYLEEIRVQVEVIKEVTVKADKSKDIKIEK